MYIVGNDSGMREAMKVVDLTHILEPGMPVYPGTEPPAFAPGSTYERDGFKETCLTLFTHTGTHMDPPSHLFAGRTTVDIISAIGNATQSFINNLVQYEQAETTKLSAEQKKKEEELDQTKDLFGQAQSLVDAVVQLMQAVRSAETQSMRDAIQA